jgi:class 3 adenylate cyclase
MPPKEWLYAKTYKTIQKSTFKDIGLVLKFMGESLLCCFGKHSNKQLLNCINDISKLSHDNNLNMNIGVNFGNVYLTNIGSIKSDYTLIGDNINISSRILNSIKNDDSKFNVSFSEKAYKNILSNINYESYKFNYRDEYKFKGKSNKIKVYDLIFSFRDFL